MSRILVDSTWYERLAPNALLELEYQRLLISHAEHLYPEYHVIPYGKLIESDFDAAIADMAFIAKDFSGWWIVEVELASHSLGGHVLPQVDVFLNGRYGLEDAEYLASHAPDLDPDRIKDVVRGEQPEVMVIVNRPLEEWANALHARGASMAIAEANTSSVSMVTIPGEIGSLPCFQGVRSSEQWAGWSGLNRLRPFPLRREPCSM
jgi:hypothetical protein